jgi:hypothetical protein
LFVFVGYKFLSAFFFFSFLDNDHGCTSNDAECIEEFRKRREERKERLNRKNVLYKNDDDDDIGK